jgi:hypothetical protein
VLLLAPTAIAGPGESAFAQDTNALRASSGLSAYRVCADLNAVARNWAAHLAAQDSLEHNPGLAGQVSGWSAIGENIGAGPSEPGVQQALVASPGHRANLLSTSYTEIGIGTAVSPSGVLYVDEVFRRPSGAGCAGGATVAAAAPPPQQASAPAPARSHPAEAAAPSTASRSTGVRRSAPTVTAPVPTADGAVLPTDHAATAARRLAADLARGVAPRDAIGSAFRFHTTFADAVR